MKSLNELLERLWQDYSAMNKQAEGIYRLLSQRGEKIENDHVAFRTFGVPKISINVLAKAFIQFGYQPKEDYEFRDKKLRAKHYEHKEKKYPKIFISELKVEEFSKELQKIVQDLIDQVPEKRTKDLDFCVAGRLWKPLSWKVYEKLLKESEYAAWTAAFGFRVNHFTVSFNALQGFKDLQEFDQFIKKNGYPMNESGGEIKGSPQDYLEQSSTLAHPVEVEFADGRKTIPACYYEFARRYPLPNGKLFQGFVAKSADKIFESTDLKPKRKS